MTPKVRFSNARRRDAGCAAHGGERAVQSQRARSGHAGEDHTLDQSRRLQLSPIGDVDAEDTGAGSRQTSEAPAGFDNQTNGFDQQGPDFESLQDNNVKPLRSFNDNRFVFEEIEGVADGLGPTYNAQSCRECHQNVVDGRGQPGHRTTNRTPERRSVLRVARRIVDSVACNVSRLDRAGCARGRHPHLPHFDEYAGCRFRRSDCEQDAAGHSRRSAAGTPGYRRHCSGPRSRQRFACRPFRAGKPACQPRVIFRGCLPQRDGSHESPCFRRRTRPARTTSPSTTRFPIRTTMVKRSRRLRISCGRPGRPPEAPITAAVTAGEQLVHLDRLRDVPRRVHHHGCSRHGDQQGSAAAAGEPR